MTQFTDYNQPNTQAIPTLVALEYSDPQMEIMETTAQRVLFLGGVGVGKSQTIAMVALDFVLNSPWVRGFIGANTYQQLSKSTLDRVKNVWEKQFKLVKGRDYVENIIPPKNFKRYGADLTSYENTISFSNGALIFTASLDNYKVIDGTEFGWACLDETKDTKEEAVKEVIIQRLRQVGMWMRKNGTINKFQEYDPQPGDTTYNPLYIFTSPSKTRWLNEWFELDEDADEIVKHIFSDTDYYRKRKGRQFVVIASSYHNKNLPAGYIQGMIEDLVGSPGLIDMLIYASPFGKTGGEFCTTYNRLKHVQNFEPWIGEAVHLSFDFNAVPYMTCTLWQIKFIEDTQRYSVRAFAEFCLPNPKNDSESLCEEIITYYSDLMLAGGVFYYGDYSGANKSTVSKDTTDNYHAIAKKLHRYLSNKSRRVIVNQGLEMRRRFVNKLFAGKFPIDIIIHKNCKELRGDLEFCKEDPDGGVLKSTVTKDGKTYQERGHCINTLEYFFTSAFNNYFKS